MINNRTLYAIEALIELANSRDYSSTAQTISESKKVPGKFLPQILSSLSNYGMVISTRGFGGGVRLAKPPEKITLLQILESMQNNIFFFDYMADQNYAAEGISNLVLKAFGNAQDAMKKELGNVTLRDIAGRANAKPKVTGKGKRKK
ncbi:MAG: Rrf2 family transcriptional regulator [Candidatus Zixiibacteriota bacterium]